MKIFHYRLQLLPHVLCVAALVPLSGCNQKPSGTTSSPGQKIASAEKNSFNEVTSQLDPGGSFYLYLSTEQWLSGISKKVGGWKSAIDGLPNLEDEQRANVDKAFGIVTRLIKDSGIEDVSGVGMSSIAREPGFYHNKAVVHHYAGQGKGFLWNMLGQKPHALNGLDLLPTNTVLATFSDLDLSMLWSVIQNQAKQSGFPQAEEFLNQLPENFESGTGIKWNKLLASLGGEFGLAVTFDEARQVPIPLPGDEPLQIPEPALMIVVKVNDDTIFNRIEKALKDTRQEVVAVNEARLKMRTVAVPLPIPIQLRPTMAASEGYLFIASTDELIRRALAVKAGKEPGLKSTAEFKHLATEMPTEGNQFFFISQRLGRKITEIQRQAMMNNNAPEGLKKLLQGWMDPNRAGFAYLVAGHTGTGWVLNGNGNQGSGPVLMAAAVAPVGLLAAIAVPNFVKARGTAQRNACMSNLRQIDLAKQQWALEKNKNSTAVPTESDVSVYLREEKLPTCPAGGSYSINAVSAKPECSQPGHGLPE